MTAAERKGLGWLVVEPSGPHETTELSQAAELPGPAKSLAFRLRLTSHTEYLGPLSP